MQTLRRIAAVLVFPAIALLGAACERTDMPTGVPPRPVATVGGPTCNVPMDYLTIQAAVNAMGCTTINVAQGMYFENVVIGRTLTLNGAQAGNPVAGRVSGGPLESTVNGANPVGANPVITISAVNVHVDGFTLRNPVTTGAAIGIDVKAAGDGALITNNFLDVINTTDMTINSTAQAVYLETGPDNVRILGNDIRNVGSLRSAKGVHIGDSNSPNPSTGILIAGNSITNITSLQRGAYGISINNGNGSTMNSGLQILNNTISTLNGGSGWVHAIGLEANTPGVVVRGNSISNLVPVPSGNTIAVWFESENTSFSTGHVNENNLDVTIANYGIAVDPALVAGNPTGTVHGECNWWGDPNGPGPVGPGLGAKVTAGVDYTPWLSAPSPNGACIGGQPSTPGKVTGGGQIDGDPVFAVDGVLLSLPALVPSLSDPNSRATFGFVVQQAVDAQFPTGNLEYNDHDAGVRIKATSFDRLVISDGACGLQTHAEFTGMATVENQTGTHTEPLTVKVDDCGNPGTMGDKFGITTVPSYSNGPSVLIGGNIKMH